MRILIIGDTHGHPESVEKAVETAGEIDLLIHTGDGWGDTDVLPAEIDRVRVTGNCDRGVKGEAERVLEMEGRRIYVTHGHKYHVKYDLNRLYYRALEERADIAIFGHSHERVGEQAGKVLLLNPGSAWRPRDGEAPGFILLEIEKGKSAFRFMDLGD